MYRCADLGFIIMSIGALQGAAKFRLARLLQIHGMLQGAAKLRLGRLLQIQPIVNSLLKDSRIPSLPLAREKIIGVLVCSASGIRKYVRLSAIGH